MKGLRISRILNEQGHFQSATVIDDENGFIHFIEVENEEEGTTLYRKLSYVMKAMTTGKVVVSVKNEEAEQLLYKITLATSGQIHNDLPLLSKSWVTGPWDEKFPSELQKATKK